MRKKFHRNSRSSFFFSLHEILESDWKLVFFFQIKRFKINENSKSASIQLMKFPKKKKQKNQNRFSTFLIKLPNEYKLKGSDS